MDRVPNGKHKGSVNRSEVVVVDSDSDSEGNRKFSFQFSCYEFCHSITHEMLQHPFNTFIYD